MPHARQSDGPAGVAPKKASGSRLGKHRSHRPSVMKRLRTEKTQALPGARRAEKSPRTSPGGGRMRGGGEDHRRGKKRAVRKKRPDREGDAVEAQSGRAPACVHRRKSKKKGMKGEMDLTRARSEKRTRKKGAAPGKRAKAVSMR